MAPSPFKSPDSWLPQPDGFPPVEERAKNLVRHFALMLLVLIVLAGPIVLAWMGRRSAARLPANGDGPESRK